MRILVTGAAGYIGSLLTAELLAADHSVRGLDDLRFGGESLLPVYGHPRFELARGDVCSDDTMRAALDGVDAVVHLAALVGDPACAVDPPTTRAINYEAACQLADLSKAAGVGRLIFTSTCSNYGISDTATLADENAPLNPVSLYAETKVAAEQYVLAATKGPFTTSVLRLATVFGLSPRPRFDLLINELVRDAVQDKRLQLYGPASWRPFIHVRDVARAFMTCLRAPAATVQGQVFNVGCGNFQKSGIAAMLQESVPELQVELLEGKADPRDYRVSFDKIERVLGFQPQFDVLSGMREIREAIVQGVIADPRSRRYRNVD